MTYALRVAVALLLVSSAVTSAFARGGTRVVTHDAKQFLEGDLDGLAIDALGKLVPAPVKVTSMSTTSLYAWSLAIDADGRLVVGAGDDGKLYRSTGRGDDMELELFADTIAFEVLSLLIEGDDVLAGTSPDGVVYRVSGDGELAVELDVPQQSVWAMESASRKGAWLAGTGPGARLVRGGEGSRAGEIVHRFAATNLTNLLRDELGLWIGTQGPGVVLRIEGEDDEPPVLRYEAPQDEIAAMVSDGDGGVYVLSTNVTGPEEDRGSHLAWIPREGAVETVWKGSDALLSLARTPDGAFLAGEAATGRILRLDLQGRLGLWAELDGGDPLAVVTDDDATYVATGNLGVVYALRPDRQSKGTFESPIVETEHAERFGRLWLDAWGDNARFQTRSGRRATPDDSWAEWTDWQDVGGVIASPPGTHLQYRIELESAQAEAVHLAWSERNLAPTVQRLKVLPAGGDVGVGGPGMGPSTIVQRFDNGLQVEYSAGKSIDRAAPEDADWVRGVRTIVWEGTDPNGDDLRYHVEARRLPDGDWFTVAEDSEERVIAWDSGSVRDGSYRIRVTATDAHVHPAGRAREGMQVSGVVRVDNTPPRIEVDRNDDTWSIAVVDALSPLVEVDARVPGEPWRPLATNDGVLDAPAESFTVPTESYPDRIWIRAVDRAGNVLLTEHGVDR